jgi:hypothetical protein
MNGVQNDKCILNVAFDGYELDRQGLARSLLTVGEDSALLFFNSEAEVGAPPHTIDHYAFKPYAFRIAQEKGYKRILWLDARIKIMKSMEVVWGILDREGYFFLNNGSITGEWSSDECLEAFRISREKALKMVDLTGCVLGLNLNNDKAKAFLDMWQLYAANGFFRGDWRNDKHQVSMDDRVKGHRHDQTCASLIANELNMTNFRTGLLWYYRDNETRPDSIIFMDGGIL